MTFFHICDIDLLTIPSYWYTIALLTKVMWIKTMSRYAALQARANAERKRIMEMSEKEFLAPLPYDTVEVKEDNENV